MSNNLKNAREKIKKIIAKAEIKKGNNIYLGVDLMRLCLLIGLKKKNFKLISDILLNEVIKKIGPNGQLLIPVFSFESLNKKFFDLKYTKSDTGEFGNCLIKKHYKQRSSHPVYSFLYFGKKKNYFLKFSNSSNEDFIWDFILNENFKLLTLGYHYVRSFSIVHHLEKIKKVKYRFKKKFYINFKINKKILNKKISFYARIKQKCHYSSITKFCDKIFFDKNFFKVNNLNGFLIYNLDFKKSSDFIMSEKISNFKKYISYVRSSNDKNLKNSKVINPKNIHILDEFYKNKVIE